MPPAVKGPGTTPGAASGGRYRGHDHGTCFARS